MLDTELFDILFEKILVVKRELYEEMDIWGANSFIFFMGGF
jgi:hypothetical protein